MKISDKYDLGKTLVFIAAMVIIAWTASGCSTLGVSEYELTDRNNRCWENFDLYGPPTLLDGGRVIFNTHLGGLNMKCDELHDARKVRQHRRRS